MECKQEQLEIRQDENSVMNDIWTMRSEMLTSECEEHAHETVNVWKQIASNSDKVEQRQTVMQADDSLTCQCLVFKAKGCSLVCNQI